jgi:hypothetical protein
LEVDVANTIERISAQICATYGVGRYTIALDAQGRATVTAPHWRRPIRAATEALALTLVSALRHY